MAKPLREWLDTDVTEVRDKPMRWLSEQYFFRDPSRAMYSDSTYFFPPADGIILYSKEVDPAEGIVEIVNVDRYRAAAESHAAQRSARAFRQVP